MNSLLAEEVSTGSTNVIPTFSELRQQPKDASEAIWMLVIFMVLFGFYIGKDVVQAFIRQQNDKTTAQLEEERAIREEREHRIEFLENLVKQLYRERAFLMKASGINSDFLKAEVTNVSPKNAVSNNQLLQK